MFKLPSLAMASAVLFPGLKNTGVLKWSRKSNFSSTASCLVLA